MNLPIVRDRVLGSTEESNIMATGDDYMHTKLRNACTSRIVLPRTRALDPVACQPVLSNTTNRGYANLFGRLSRIPYNGPGRGDEQVPWTRYLVARRCIPILNKIIGQYPELLSSFNLESEEFLSGCLELLVEVFYELVHLKVGINLNLNKLDGLRREIQGLKHCGIEVDWIEKRWLKKDAAFKKVKLVHHQRLLIHEVEMTNMNGELLDVTTTDDSTIIKEQPRRSDRRKRPPSYLRDYELHQLENSVTRSLKRMARERPSM